MNRLNAIKKNSSDNYLRMSLLITVVRANSKFFKFITRLQIAKLWHTCISDIEAVDVTKTAARKFRAEIVIH